MREDTNLSEMAGIVINFIAWSCGSLATCYLVTSQTRTDSFLPAHLERPWAISYRLKRALLLDIWMFSIPEEHKFGNF